MVLTLETLRQDEKRKKGYKFAIVSEGAVLGRSKTYEGAMKRRFEFANDYNKEAQYCFSKGNIEQAKRWDNLAHEVSVEEI